MIPIPVLTGKTNEFCFEAVTTGVSETFTLPIYDGGDYNFRVNWGDGNIETITAFDDAAVTHTYASAGTHDVSISGTLNGWRFNNLGDKTKIHDIKNWGCFRPGNLNGYFYGCNNLTVSATDVLDLSEVTTLYRAFRGCTLLTTLDVSNCDISAVTDLSQIFYGCNSIVTLDMNNCDISAVTDLSFAFYLCSLLTDPEINNWNIGLVTNATGFMNSAKALSTSVYDATLIAWQGQSHQNNVVVDFDASKYTAGGAAATARAALVSDGWGITDGGSV